MNRYLGLAAIAVVVLSSTALIRASAPQQNDDAFLTVGHRYRCIVHGEDFEIVVHELVDHQWVRAELLEHAQPSAGPDSLPMLVNLSRVNAIMPLDPSELPARFQQQNPQPQ